MPHPIGAGCPIPFRRTGWGTHGIRYTTDVRSRPHPILRDWGTQSAMVRRRRSRILGFGLWSAGVILRTAGLRLAARIGCPIPLRSTGWGTHGIRYTTDVRSRPHPILLDWGTQSAMVRHRAPPHSGLRVVVRGRDLRDRGLAPRGSDRVPHSVAKHGVGDTRHPIHHRRSITSPPHPPRLGDSIGHGPA